MYASIYKLFGVFLLLPLLGCTGPTLLYDTPEGNIEICCDPDPSTLIKNGSHPRWIPGVKDAIAFWRENSSGNLGAIYIATYGMTNKIYGVKNIKQLTDGTAGRNFSWSPDREWIAFEAQRGGNWNIYKIHVSNGTELQLTRDTGNDKNPAWSPTNELIAFQSDRLDSTPLIMTESDIWVMSPDGSNQSPLTINTLIGRIYEEPRWSRDGTKLAFVGMYGAQRRVHIATPPSASSVQPISLGGVINIRPAWDPDDDYLFYIVDEKHGTKWLQRVYKQNVENLKAEPISPTFGIFAGDNFVADHTHVFYSKFVDDPVLFVDVPIIHALNWRDGSEQAGAVGRNPSVYSGEW